MQRASTVCCEALYTGEACMTSMSTIHTTAYLHISFVCAENSIEGVVKTWLITDASKRKLVCWLEAQGWLVAARPDASFGEVTDDDLLSAKIKRRKERANILLHINNLGRMLSLPHTQNRISAFSCNNLLRTKASFTRSWDIELRLIDEISTESAFDTFLFASCYSCLSALRWYQTHINILSLSLWAPPQESSAVTHTLQWACN